MAEVEIKQETLDSLDLILLRMFNEADVEMSREEALETAIDAFVEGGRRALFENEMEKRRPSGNV